ncbi:MAG: hypothetical protein M3Y56_04485 [Armatimonadota bacterium]|nr:hypothetical protein [Armatimonadota bacterium]
MPEGGIRVYRNYLVSLLAIYSTWERDAETVLRKAHYAKFSDWPPVEQEAVRNFLWEWWRCLLRPVSEEVEFYYGDRLICAIAGFVEDLQPFLDEWSSSGSTASARALAAFVQSTADDLMKTHRLGSEWQERPLQMEQAIAWVIQPARKEALEGAFFEQMDGPYAHEFAWADQLLEGVLEAFKSG